MDVANQQSMRGKEALKKGSGLQKPAEKVSKGTGGQRRENTGQDQGLQHERRNGMAHGQTGGDRKGRKKQGGSKKVTEVQRIHFEASKEREKSTCRQRLKNKRVEEGEEG